MRKAARLGQLMLENETQQPQELDITEIPQDQLGEFADTFEGNSLIAGLELDEEFSEAQHYEIPEDQAFSVADVQQEVAALESRIQDLIYLHADVLKSQGMSQRFALEAQKLLPDSFTEPASYYSQEPSITRYKVSLERLSGGIWALILAAIAAAVLMIMKIYKWVTGKKEGEASAKDATRTLKEEARVAQATPEVLAKTATLVQKADGMLRRANITLKDATGREYKVSSMQEVIDRFMNDSERYDRAKQLLKLRDPVLREIINHGEYYKRMLEVGRRVGLLKTVLMSQVTLLDGVVRSDLSSHHQSDRLRSMNLLKTLNKEVTFQFEDQRVTMAQAARLLGSRRQEVQAQELSDQAINFDQLYIAMAQSYRQQGMNRVLEELSTSMQLMATLEERLEKLQAVARDLSTDGSPGALTQDIGVEVRSVITKIANDVAGFGMLVHEVKFFTNVMQHLANLVMGLAKEVIVKTAREMRKNNQEVPEGWQELLKELALEKKAMERAYFSF